MRWILVSRERRQYSKQNCSTLLEEELTRVAAVGQSSGNLVKAITALPTLQELAELPQLPIATCPVDRRNKILLTRQSPGRPHQNSHLYTNTRNGNLRNNSRNFTE
jgi:hypothetical protein